jgi:hypothetical protein
MLSRWKQSEVVFAVWSTLALVILLPITRLLNGSFPLLTVLWILLPLQGVLYALGYSWLAVGVIGGWAASRTKSIWPSLFSVTVANLVFVALMV